MDKAIKQHFNKSAKTPQEKSLLNKMLTTDKKLDRLVDQDKTKKK